MKKKEIKFKVNEKILFEILFKILFLVRVKLDLWFYTFKVKFTKKKHNLEKKLTHPAVAFSAGNSILFTKYCQAKIQMPKQVQSHLNLTLMKCEKNKELDSRRWRRRLKKM